MNKRQLEEEIAHTADPETRARLEALLKKREAAAEERMRIIGDIGSYLASGAEDAANTFFRFTVIACIVFGTIIAVMLFLWLFGRL